MATDVGSRWGANLNDTMKLADLENRQFGTRVCMEHYLTY